MRTAGASQLPLAHSIATALSGHHQGRENEENERTGQHHAAHHADYERHEEYQVVAAFVEQGRQPQMVASRFAECEHSANPSGASSAERSA